MALQRRQPGATEKAAREPNGRQVLQVQAMFVPRETMLHVVPRFPPEFKGGLEKKVWLVLSFHCGWWHCRHAEQRVGDLYRQRYRQNCECS